MDNLLATLLQRQLGQDQQAPQEVPTIPPSTTTKVLPQVQRFANAQRIQEAYRSGWTPNPVLLRVLLGHRPR